MEPSVYQPLNQRDHIRVLKVLPATDKDSNISATFQVESLAGHGPLLYEALSYMWGDQAVRATIELNGTPFSVSQHLQGAIRTLRKGTEPRYLWIDAICINQADIQERNQQVQLMRTIYRRAKCVLVWLDREIDPSHPSFQKLQTLSERSELGELGGHPDLWDPICDVFKDPYWSRVWIQQEISNAAVLRLFSREVELNSYAIYHLLRLFSQIQLENILGQTWWDWALKKPSVMLPHRFGLENAHKEPIEGSTLGKTELDLIETLSRTCTLKCTDDRDRVYGIMFLAQDCQEGDVKVDYRLTVPQVYTEVVKCLITKYRSTRFLLYSTLDHNATDPSTKTPSWVPDWRHPPTRPSMARPLPPLKQTPLCNQPNPLPKITDTTLSLLAIKVDTVHTAYHSLFATDLLSQSLTTFINTCTLITSDAIAHEATLNQQPPTPPSPELQTTPQWRSLLRTLAGLDHRDKTKHPNLETALYRGGEELLDLTHQRDTTDTHDSDSGFNPDTYLLGRIVSLPGDAQVLRLAKLFVSFAWWVLTKKRVVFLSGKGRVGLAPWCVRAGDEVWLVPGCEMLVLMRGVGGNGRGYEVVGEGYLDGENFWEGVWGWKGVDEAREGEVVGGLRVEVVEVV
ncbi:heterokaryon incompatibility protein-domain-containing protein [Triangularia verruculosa]|uniref:Heterokaryon incompatibility protein-domain-containing protein n=1 Tax=Triangularia verruculosa TaxID=2587418 RepID=A0AAN7ASE5_9PEZI|nr:heterokaryon incompatibility protein-domain-containing protein [Triangularia verruculosa]